jgi:hypothetical protein
MKLNNLDVLLLVLSLLVRQAASKRPTVAPTTNASSMTAVYPSPSPSNIMMNSSTSTDVVATNTTAFNTTTIPTMSPSTLSPTFSPSSMPSFYPTIPSNANYYDLPELKWSTKLEGTGFSGSDAKLSAGNAVTSSPDGVLVYVTTNKGGLHVLAAHDGSDRWSYTPEPIAPGWEVACNSGVYFGNTSNGEQYAVWAVIDVPPYPDEVDHSS